MYEPYERNDEFEQELKDGLRPREVPEGFAERVLALAAGVKAGTLEVDELTRVGARNLPDPVAGVAVSGRVRAIGMSSALDRRPILRWAIAATLLLSIALGGYAERRRQIAGEHARQQVLLALRITGSTLRAVHDRVAVGDE